MKEIIVYINYGGMKFRQLLIPSYEYKCLYWTFVGYGVIVIEDIAKAWPGRVLGTYYSDTLTIGYVDKLLVLETKDRPRVETGVSTIVLNPTIDKFGVQCVEVIKPFTINA